jgi:hypothetical protein
MENKKFNGFAEILSQLQNSDKSEQKETANNILSHLDSQDAKQINDFMKDKEKVDALLNSPAAQQIINKLNGKNNGQHQ